MSDYIKIPENIRDIADGCWTRSAEIYAESLSQFHFSAIQDHGITSPIEQAFLAGAIAVAHANHCNLLVGDRVMSFGGLLGIDLYPQARAGNYRVDFLLQVFEKGEWTRQVAVELDGHQFHDRDEKQRRYEKARDRFLQSQGMVVAHFTGSEVIADPEECFLNCLRLIVDGDKYLLGTTRDY